ncbi:LysR family transcriptional regulator [soil metagenome]
MLIRQLEYVVAVAREGHFGRAAASCWVTTPTLSDGVSRLEAELGVILVRRTRRYEGLTPEGEKLVAWAQRMLSERTDLVAELGAARRDVPGRLRIGVIPTALPAIPLITEELARRRPGVAVDVHSMPAQNIIRGLSTFELDAGLSYLDDSAVPGEITTLPLYSERYLVITPREGPLGDRQTVTWAQLAELPLCLLSRQLQNRRILDRRFDVEGISVSPGVETDSLSVLSGHLRTGLWTSVVPQSWLHLFGLPERTRLLPLSGEPLSATVGLMVLTREPMPTLVISLAETLKGMDLQNTLDISAKTVM